MFNKATGWFEAIARWLILVPAPQSGEGRMRRIVRLLAVTIALLCLAFTASAGAKLRIDWMPGFPAPGTPSKYDRVGVIKIGPQRAKNVLVLEPGTSAGAAYFVPLAQWIVSRTTGWQVWSVERRENLLEDQSELDLAKAGRANAAQLFDYYLGWIKDPAITRHFQFIPGYALNVRTSPAALALAQAHLGRGVTATGNPHGWNGSGALTPISRFATMFSGYGVQGADGTEWYFPERLTLDAGAVDNGNTNPAQRVLDVKATMGAKLPHDLRIYAFGARLGGQKVLTDAQRLARQSDIPMRNLMLVNRQSTYAHNDPAGAYPRNAFFAHLVPFLGSVGSVQSHPRRRDARPVRSHT
jgi:hypothetical protein